MPNKLYDAITRKLGALEVKQRVAQKRKLVEQMAGRAVAPRKHKLGRCGACKQTTIERELTFWSKTKIQKSGCWFFKGVRQGEYGRFYHMGRKVVAHKYAFIKTFGMQRKKVFYLHKCDETRCVRPDHIFEGTNTDNVRDSIKKGRFARACGEKHGMHVLKSADVLKIRKMLSSGITQTIIANQYGVRQATISLIKTRRSWKCLK